MTSTRLRRIIDVSHLKARQSIANWEQSRVLMKLPKTITIALARDSSSKVMVLDVTEIETNGA
jgi:hypothetical protein